MHPNEPPFMQWAHIHMNDDFVAIEPLSGYRRARRDDDLYNVYLDPTASDEALGAALLEALDRSRFIDPVADRSFFAPERFDAVEKRWHGEVMKRFRYKTKRQLYKNMRYCRAERSEGRLSLEPFGKGPRPGYIEMLPPDQNVVIPASLGPAATGAALRLALSRCPTF